MYLILNMEKVKDKTISNLTTLNYKWSNTVTNSHTKCHLITVGTLPGKNGHLSTTLCLSILQEGDSLNLDPIDFLQ
jgi:hypothetical protein